MDTFFRTLDPLSARIGQYWLQLPAAFGPDSLAALWAFLDSLPAAFRYGVEVRHPAFFAKGEAERALNRGLHQRGVNRVILDSRPVHASSAVTPATLDAKAVAVYAQQAEQQGIVAFLLDIIPGSVIGAFASGNILQVLLFAILFGFALHRLGDKGTLIFNVIDSFSKVIFGVINMIMRLAPIGAFGAMAFTIGKYGVGSLVQLGQLIICFYITCILFVVFVLGTIARVTGFNIFKFIGYIKEELLIVLGTSSSESALPRMLDKMEKLGCKKSVVGLVIPTGYSFNLDGTSIYLTMAAVFIAQATNSHMDIFHQITLLVVLLLSSKGAAGVTGSGFIVLAATLSAVGHLPVAGLALILGIDHFMSEARALTNLVGNGVATIVVAKWVDQLDEKQLHDELSSSKKAKKLPGASL
ncbi:MAG: C4-dicarboxylate transporter DctA [Pantoea sp.]|nr:C4-dicarboxylate transporter DctA [Pantoea sp.]